MCCVLVHVGVCVCSCTLQSVVGPYMCRMTIDLIAAGNRGLETIDSMTDLQNVLNILNHDNNLVYFKNSLNNSVSNLDKVVKYIAHNNSFPAEIHQPPLTNSPPGFGPQITSGLYKPPTELDPGYPDNGQTTLHDPQSSIKLSDSRIYKFSTPPIPVITDRRINFF